MEDTIVTLNVYGLTGDDTVVYVSAVTFFEEKGKGVQRSTVKC